MRHKKKDHFSNQVRQSPRFEKPRKLSKPIRKEILIDIGESDDRDFAISKSLVGESGISRGKSIYENDDVISEHHSSNPTNEPNNFDKQNCNEESETGPIQLETNRIILFDELIIVPMQEDISFHPIPEGGVIAKAYPPMEAAGSASTETFEATAGTSRDRLPFIKQRVKQKKGCFQCKTCQKMFAFKHNLTKHQFIHLPKECHTCDWCERIYSNVVNLKQHKHRFPSKLQCSRCGFKCHKELLPHEYCRKCPNSKCTFVTQSHTIYLKHQLKCNGMIECPEPGCLTNFKSPSVYSIRRHNLEFHNKYII